MKTHTHLLIILFGLFGLKSNASELNFKEVWKSINAKSSAQESIRLNNQATTESKIRAEKHWIPKLYIDAKAYQSNDPGSVFFGLLEQKSLQQSDFAPSSLNSPELKLFSRGALGLDLPLYEGGMRISQIESLKAANEAGTLQMNQVQLDQFSTAGNFYGSLIVLAKQKIYIQELKVEIEKLLKSYQLGNRSNPVGYSGLLGMQAVQNKIDALSNQFEGQTRSYQMALHEMGLEDQNLQVKEKDSLAFIAQYFPVREEKQSHSFKLDSLKAESKSIDEMLNMEKAKNRPRVGVFAETYTFNGSRSTANAYLAGLYLQWSLYNSADAGLDKETSLKSLSKQKSVEALNQQENAERSALIELSKSIKQNLDILNSTQKIMAEQIKVAESLFRNGSINALQLVEVLNRKADLIQQQTEAELAYIKTATQFITKTQFNVADADNK